LLFFSVASKEECREEASVGNLRDAQSFGSVLLRHFFRGAGREHLGIEPWIAAERTGTT